MCYQEYAANWQLALLSNLHVLWNLFDENIVISPRKRDKGRQKCYMSLFTLLSLSSQKNCSLNAYVQQLGSISFHFLVTAITLLAFHGFIWSLVWMISTKAFLLISTLGLNVHRAGFCVSVTFLQSALFVCSWCLWTSVKFIFVQQQTTSCLW